MNLRFFDIQLQEFRTFRKNLNQQLSAHISKRFGDTFFAREIMARIEKGRKIRSLLFMRTAEALHPSVDQDLLFDICLSIEMCHAASVLVDDILDGDDTRHGFATAHSTLGTPASVLEAHFLCAESMNLVREQPDILRRLIDTYRRLTVAEAYDILLPEPLDAWICDGYTERVFQKTSALFEYSLASAGSVTKEQTLLRELQSLGGSFGKLYQFSNDFFDLQSHNLPKRHAAKDSWRITFSLPLALYLRRYKLSEIESELKARVLTYTEWVTFLNKIWTTEVKNEALCALRLAEVESCSAIADSKLPIGLRDQFLRLVKLIVQEEFWYHSYVG
jgi:geranylgeranyl pyrophosphate synthase